MIARCRLAVGRAGTVVSVVVLLAAGLTAAGCTSSSSARRPTLKGVAALLARHGRAVLDHDRAAFLADVDPAGPAATFRTRQGTEFTNLQKLPLAGWAYRVESRTDDRAFEAAATKKLGSPALLVHVTLRYSLRGVDTAPSSRDLWWTFVRHDGRTALAGDDALAQAGGMSWRGPWDFGPLDVVRGAHSLVLGHTPDDATLHAVARIVDAAIPAVSAVWGTAWAQRVAVVVPASAGELAAQVGEASTVTTQIAAVAVSDGAHAATGAVTSQRLIVNPAAFARLSPVGRRIVIRHEVTHIADARSTTDASPRWLVEGFADYVGNLGTGQSVARAASELRADVTRGRIPAALPDDAAFDTDTQAAPAYESSWLACRLIAQRVGAAGLVRFYRTVGAAPADPDAAVAAAVSHVLDETTARFTAQWRAYLRTELGR